MRLIILIILQVNQAIMSAKFRFILVLLSCLLISSGTISRLHHHTESDGVCFCMDHDGQDSCSHHHDNSHTHSDNGACPYKIVAFKHSAGNGLSLVPLIISSAVFYQAEEACQGRHDFTAFSYGHSPEVHKWPDLSASGLRAPPCFTTI